MTRVATEIPVASGVFASQPLVFAHLLDMAPDTDLDRIDVMQGTNLRARLGHYFAPQIITGILTEMGEADTLVLFLPGALPLETPRLRFLGLYPGTVVRAT
jgi:hypothetical protein